MDISPNLLDQIQNGKVVLVLGAGASLDAKDKEGNSPPSGRKLGELIAARFLGGKFNDATLSQIAEYAISESDLATVQGFIKDILEPFEPSQAHLWLPQFVWGGLATTNYDLLIEKAYAGCSNPLQVLQPFIENGDRVDDRMRDQKGVMLLKLHGCITRLQNPECPLILTTDQYVTHRQGRSRLFEHLKDWGYERTFVFVGHSLQDSDIRLILHELTSTHPTRPRYFLVAPEKDSIESRFWETKRVSVINATFHAFIHEIDRLLAGSLRVLAAATAPTKYPVSAKFAVPNAILSVNCTHFLDNDVDYVAAAGKTETTTAHEFYRGYSGGWAPIEQKLDIRRALGDTILTDYVIADEAEHGKDLEVILIKAHAGGGKSTLLRRIAWDAAHDYDKLCLYLKGSGVINSAALLELVQICKERVFLFVDDLGDRLRELQSLARAIGSGGAKITVIAAERMNEWNVVGGSVAALITEEYELKYLSEAEIEQLLKLLAEHRSLGTLEGKEIDEQKKAFREHAGRQLLVALHEATLGRPFEDIVKDEYDHIVPDEAQRVYLSVCVLNRLGVLVRAGVISRLHGIRLSDFAERFFKPLEHVVYTVHDQASRDLAYVARHPVIAEIVFTRVLTEQEERFETYYRVLQTLNVDYDSDRKAFRAMTRGRSVLELFPNRELAERIYSFAHRSSPHDAHLLHQHGLYEMRSGNLTEASELFGEALRIAPNNYPLKHSRAELLLKLADNAKTDLQRNTFLREATDLAGAIKNARLPDSHAHHTLVKIGLSKLRSLLAQPDTEARTVEAADAIRTIEKNLMEGLLEFPNDSYLLSADSEFGDVVKDSARLVGSLSKAFDANPRAGFLAIRLASQYEKLGKFVDARSILEKALAANRGDRALHYRYAKHLMKAGSHDGEVLLYHLQRGFTPGDKSYDAQLLYGRQLFINGEKEASYRMFRGLKAARVAPAVRSQLSYPLEGECRGSVARVEASYLTIMQDGTNETIFAHRGDIDNQVWRSVSYGARIRFRIAFNFHGASAFDLHMDSLL